MVSSLVPKARHYWGFLMGFLSILQWVRAFAPCAPPWLVRRRELLALLVKSWASLLEDNLELKGSMPVFQSSEIRLVV